MFASLSVKKSFFMSVKFFKKQKLPVAPLDLFCDSVDIQNMQKWNGAMEASNSARTISS